MSDPLRPRMERGAFRTHYGIFSVVTTLGETSAKSEVRESQKTFKASFEMTIAGLSRAEKREIARGLHERGCAEASSLWARDRAAEEDGVDWERFLEKSYKAWESAVHWADQRVAKVFAKRAAKVRAAEARKRAKGRHGR